MIAGLHRDVDIERLPIAAVTAELKRLGIDPASSIALARHLAGDRRDDPASSLLKTLEEADAIDAEIADLERASLDDVRARLATGQVETAAVADAKTAGDVLRPAPMTGRRASGLGWRASLAGIAACLLMVIAIRSTVFEPAGPADRQPPNEDVPIATVDSGIATAVGRAATEAEIRPSPAPLSRRQATPLAETDMQAFRFDESAPALADGLMAGDAAPTAAMSVLPRQPGAIVGMLVVDATRLPPALATLPSAAPDERLSAKLDEARERAGGRRLVALLAFERDGKRVEAALVEVPDERGAGTAETLEHRRLASTSGERSLELIELTSDR